MRRLGSEAASGPVTRGEGSCCLPGKWEEAKIGDDVLIRMQSGNGGPSSQRGGCEPHVATEPLRYGWSKLRRAFSVKYIWVCKASYQKRNVSYLVNRFILVVCYSGNIFDVLGSIDVTGVDFTLYKKPF